jgi:hypothetical protein
MRKSSDKLALASGSLSATSIGTPPRRFFKVLLAIVIRDKYLLCFRISGKYGSSLGHIRESEQEISQHRRRILAIHGQVSIGQY